MMSRTLAWSACLLCAGCGGDARLELAAADAIDALAKQMATAVREYHAEVERADDAREAAVADAFVRRIVADHEEDGALERHVEAFRGAMGRIRSDRRVEWGRWTAVLENVAVMRGLSDGLRESAWQGMTLDDELRRYFRRWSAPSPAPDGVAEERIAESGVTP